MAKFLLRDGRVLLSTAVGRVGRFITDLCASVCCGDDLWVQVRSCIPEIQAGTCEAPPTVMAWFRYSLKDQNGNPIAWVAGNPDAPLSTSPVFYHAGRCWVAEYASTIGPQPRGLTSGLLYDTRVVTLLENGCENERCDDTLKLVPMRLCGVSASEDILGTIVYVCPSVAALGVIRLPTNLTGPGAATNCAGATGTACYCVAENVEPLSASEATTAGYPVWLSTACGSGYTAGGCCQCAGGDLSGPCIFTPNPTEGDFAGTGNCCCPRTGQRPNWNMTWRSVLNRTDVETRPFAVEITEVWWNGGPGGGIFRYRITRDEAVLGEIYEVRDFDALVEGCSRQHWRDYVRNWYALYLYVFGLNGGDPWPGGTGGGEYAESVGCGGGSASFSNTIDLADEGGPSYGSLAWQSSVAFNNVGSGEPNTNCQCDPGTPVPDPVGASGMAMVPEGLAGDPMGVLPA